MLVVQDTSQSDGGRPVDEHAKEKNSPKSICHAATTRLDLHAAPRHRDLRWGYGQAELAQRILVIAYGIKKPSTYERDDRLNFNYTPHGLRP
jgi:hypothetical protein